MIVIDCKEPIAYIDVRLHIMYIVVVSHIKFQLFKCIEARHLKTERKTVILQLSLWEIL